MANHKKTTPAASVTPASEATRAPKPRARGIRKKFSAAGPVCRVTFTLPREAAFEAEAVCIMGEFNNWSPDATPMKRRTNGDFSITLDLEKGRSYRFRYLIDGCTFENDWKADRYESNPYGGEDSVVEL